MKQFTLLLTLLLLSSSLWAEVRIAVLGVSNNMELFERWAVAEGASVEETKETRSFRAGDMDALILAPKPSASLSVVASTVYQADVAILVVDTIEGPLPINREHIIISRQAGVRNVAIMLANVDQLYALAPADARDYLAYEEAEIRNILALYEVGGRDPLVFHDSRRKVNAPQSAAGGLREAVSVISRLGATRDQPPRIEPQRSAQAQVYLLADAEADGHSVTISKSAPMQMWSEGSSTRIEVATTDAAGPGDFADVFIRSAEVFTGQRGSQILLIKNGHIVGLGVLTEVSSF